MRQVAAVTLQGTVYQRWEVEPGDMVPCHHCGAVKIAHEGHGQAGRRVIDHLGWKIESCPGFISRHEWERLASGEGLREIVEGLSA